MKCPGTESNMEGSTVVMLRGEKLRHKDYSEGRERIETK